MKKASSPSQKPPKPGKGAVGKALAAPEKHTIPFNIEAEKLPEWVERKAFGSGGYPHKHKMKPKLYDKELWTLQVELLKLLDWVKREGQRIVIVFEGRDAAGKGGAIQRLTQHLNPRSARIVALPKPTDVEARQWYFQRYIAQMPPKGEIAIFDRSWYNSAGVERVFGFCTPEQTDAFLSEAPQVEAMLVRDGVRIIKIFLSIGPEMQMKRLHARWHDPLKRWKLSDLDFKAIEKWNDYSTAYERALSLTDSAEAPWTIIKANDKRRTRLEVIRHIIKVLPYTGKNPHLGEADHGIVLSAAKFLSEGSEVG